MPRGRCADAGAPERGSAGHRRGVLRRDVGGVHLDQPAPGAGLIEDLLAALVEMVYPHGELDAAGSVRLYVAAVRNMAAALAVIGFTGGAGELTRAQLAQYWLAAPAWAEGCTRRLMRAFGQAGGTQAGGVAELAAGRAYKSRDTHPLKPYGESEWAALTDACAGVVAESYRAHRAALASATRGADPAVAGWSPDNLRWLLARSGPATLAAVSAHAGLSINVARARGGYAQASTELFPHINVVIGYRLLLGVYSGVVPDGIDNLVTTDIDWAGDATVLLSYVKGRTAAESVNLPKPAVRLLEQWLAHSALLRASVPPEERQHLWLRVRGPGTDQVCCGAPDRHRNQDWVRRHQVRARRRRAAEDPAGSDPHHSPGDARQQRLVGQQTGGDRPEPHSAGGGRPLPVGADVGAAAAGRHRHRRRPA